MLNSLAASTVKQYTSALLQWKKFCLGYGGQFFNPDLRDVLNFLTQAFVNGSAYGSINTMRCAISLISPDKVGDNPLVNRLMRGIYRANPQAPRYQATWDVAIVLDYLKKLHPLNSLPLSVLAEKTVMLLALSTAHRSQTLAKIELQNIVTTSDGVQIRITETIKTSGPGRAQPLLLLPFFKDNPRLCVATAVKRYIKVTKELRGSCNYLLIATKKPYKRIGSQTVG